MKIIITALTIIYGFTLTSCSSSADNAEKVIYVKKSDIIKKNINVSGMTCVGCEVTLEENVSTIEGVVSVKASHTDKGVVIEFDSTRTDIATITEAIKESGYQPF